MFKLFSLTTVAVVVLIVIPGVAASKPSLATSTSGSWQVDSANSDAELVSDGLTNYRTSKVNFTLGYGRMEGNLQLDGTDLTNSEIDFDFYPANSTQTPIAEDGTLKKAWIEDPANQTLMCFHSKHIVRTPDGKLLATGDLAVTQVERSVEVDPSEAYSGPIYGRPVVHRTSREVSFVIDAGQAPIESNNHKDIFEISGSTNISRESYPELVRAAVDTSWPALAQGDAHCWNPAAGTEDYHGFICSGKYLSGSELPRAPIQIGEDYPGSWNYNAITGSKLTIVIHARLTPEDHAAPADGM